MTTAMQAIAPGWMWAEQFCRPSLLLEQRAGIELAELFASPVYYGAGVPRGDGAPVLLLPGFLGSDGYLTVLSGWLRRTGYRPHASHIPVMAGSPFDLIGRILRRAEAIQEESGRPLTIIGHSMGGVLACLLARLRPDLLAHVITLGSPLTQDGRRAAHPLVALLAHLLVRESLTPAHLAGERALERELFTGPIPERVRLTCIYSKEDAVIDWRTCVDASAHAIAHEVRGTHIGLAWNAQVYYHLGRELLDVVRET